MYDKPIAPIGSGVAAGGAASLADTGANALYIGLAAFALVAVGAALLRILPRLGFRRG
ncbi:hypothetical protein [Allostreptomyces psammosilenae]|uniref:Uncharacterized protein n=1 Tax=Allostreptomyces psammosilenae TaxID=1892865 RepID=A0A852ZSB1_9ACTN|nr:hypothetical protein [Allostreptomyces psammosilenae]NYI04705.1 hypothetical protein [Allostreptomyces psammosilenae]